MWKRGVQRTADRCELAAFAANCKTETTRAVTSIRSPQVVLCDRPSEHVKGPDRCLTVGRRRSSRR